MSAANFDDSGRLQAAVQQAQGEKQPLRIMGQGSKARLLAPISGSGQLLSTTEHRGIETYAPDELVVTVRAGTPVAELNAMLAAHGQMLACDPPQDLATGSVGGAVAAGLAGPGQPWRGGVRDSVLGVSLLNGMGEIVNFGGQVMKNVAGYDVSRLQVGACGAFGVLLNVSLRVAPLPPVETSCEFELPLAGAYQTLRELAVGILPVTALSYIPAQEQAWVRFSGPPQVVADATQGFGVSMRDPEQRWQSLRDHTHPFFAEVVDESQAPLCLWRVSLPLGAEDLALPHPTLVEWGGALRWLAISNDDPKALTRLQQRVQELGGHVRQFGGGVGVAPTVPASQQPLVKRLRQAFDPLALFNPGLVASAN